MCTLTCLGLILLAQVGHGLEYAALKTVHDVRRGSIDLLEHLVTHLDVKPDNRLLEEDVGRLSNEPFLGAALRRRLDGEQLSKDTLRMYLSDWGVAQAADLVKRGGEEVSELQSDDVLGFGTLV
jgi:serine/threonine protein kinase